MDEKIKNIRKMLEEKLQCYKRSFIEISPYCDAYKTEKETREHNSRNLMNIRACEKILRIVNRQDLTEREKQFIVDTIELKYMVEDKWGAKYYCSKTGDNNVLVHYPLFHRGKRVFTKEEAKISFKYVIDNNSGKPKKFIYLPMADSMVSIFQKLEKNII